MPPKSAPGPKKTGPASSTNSGGMSPSASRGGMSPRRKQSVDASMGMSTSLTLAGPAGARKKSTATAGGDDSLGNSTNIEDRSVNNTSITKFRVFSRVRPFIDEELRDMAAAGGGELRSIVEMVGNRTIILDPKEDWKAKKQFGFDASLWSIPPNAKLVHTFEDTKHDSYITQQDVYNMTAKGCVTDALGGFNTCILTYGQTGSGKTYTMMGKYNPESSTGGEGEEGIIPRVCNELFEVLDNVRKKELEKPEKDRASYTVEVNFVEIYMEKVRDLLDPNQKPKSKGDPHMSEAKVRNDPDCGPYVEGVTKYVVESWQQCCLLLERGSKMRTTAATVVHNQSSRSHALFQITILQSVKHAGKDRYSHDVVKTKAGRINLVDLAGSERGGNTDYVKESAKINNSLLSLRRVIDNLVERQNILLEQARKEVEGSALSQAELEKALPQVPYRDSVLTWLLSDSIGGNARTTMLATLSPMARNFGDTMSTLDWSSKARNLVTVVKANDISSSISDGYSSRREEMQGKLHIQRTHVDSIRGQLDSLTDQVAATEAETLKLQKGTIKAREDGDHFAHMRVVWLIHLYVQRWKKSKAEKEKRALLDAATADRDAAQERRDDASERYNQSQATLSEKKADAAVITAALTEEETKLKELQKRKKEMEKKQAQIKEKAEALQQKEQALQAECDEEAEQVSVAVIKVRDDTAAVQRECDALTQEIKDMEKAIEECPKDIEAQIEELKKKNAAAAERIAKLKEEKKTKTEKRDNLKRELKK